MLHPSSSATQLLLATALLWLSACSAARPKPDFHYRAPVHRVNHRRHIELANYVLTARARSNSPGNNRTYEVSLLQRQLGGRVSVVLAVHADDRLTLTYLLNGTVYQLDRLTGVCTKETQAGRLGDEHLEPLLADAFSRPLIADPPMAGQFTLESRRNHPLGLQFSYGYSFEQFPMRVNDNPARQVYTLDRLALQLREMPDPLAAHLFELPEECKHLEREDALAGLE